MNKNGRSAPRGLTNWEDEFEITPSETFQHSGIYLLSWTTLLTSHVNRKGIKALKSLEQFDYYHYGRIFHKQAPRNRQNTGNVTFSDEYPRSTSYCPTTKAKDRLRQVLRYYNPFLEILSRTNIGGEANKFLNLTKIRAMLRIVYGEKRKNVSPSFLFLPEFWFTFWRCFGIKIFKKKTT